MPPKSRTQRRAAFSGSLLTVPEPLPDDDPTQEASPKQALAAAPEPEPQSDKAPTAVPAKCEEPHSLPTTQEVPSPPTPEPNQPATAKRDRPPETVRLDKRASAELWDVYIQAKTADPFLSYRQFASGVVLDGLATHRRRQSRMSSDR